MPHFYLIPARVKTDTNDDQSIINAVVLTSTWSAGNAFFYSSTRVLYASALDGKAPAFFRFERFGVPYACVIATSCFGALAYLNVSSASADVFFWFSNISAVSTLIVWTSIMVSQQPCVPVLCVG